MVHYTFQHIYTITELSPEWLQYYMNIISLVSANAGIQGIYMNEQYKRHSRVYTWELERHTGGPGRMELRRSAGGPRYRCATLVSSWENPYAPSSMTWTWGPGESVTLPRRVGPIPSGEAGRAQGCKWYQVRSTQEADRLEQVWHNKHKTGNPI